jgi:hypothetical protein
MNEAKIVAGSSIFQIVSQDDNQINSSRGEVYHLVRCADGGIRLSNVEINELDGNGSSMNQSFDYFNNKSNNKLEPTHVTRSQSFSRSQSFRDKTNVLPFTARSQSMTKLNEPFANTSLEFDTKTETLATDTHESNFSNKNTDSIYTNELSLEPTLYPLTSETILKLQEDTSEFVLNHEAILNSINENSQMVKKIDEEKQSYVEYLEEEFKKAQEELNKQMKLKMKFLNDKMDRKKEKYKREIKYLREQQQEETHDYFSKQKSTIDQYKRELKLLLN